MSTEQNKKSIWFGKAVNLDGFFKANLPIWKENIQKAEKFTSIGDGNQALPPYLESGKNIFTQMAQNKYRQIWEKY